MELEAIIVAQLEQTLRSWQQGQQQQPALTALDCLPEQADSAVERAYILHDFLRELVVDALSAQRRAEGLTVALESDAQPARQALEEQLRRDFGTNNGDLEGWSALYHRYFAPVPFSVEDLAQAIPVVPRHFRRRVQRGLQLLVDRLRRLELDAHRQHQEQRRRRHLPAAEYTTLFGVDRLVDNLVTLLETEAGPLFLSVEGLGGIGKTALARATAHRCAARGSFEDIAWISARQTWLDDQAEIAAVADGARTLDDLISRLAEQLGQSHLAGLAADEKLARLQPLLQRKRQLIVFDNLETVSDINAVFPALVPLAGETRMLLTSRESLDAYSQVQRVAVPELSLADSKALVEAEMARRGRHAALSAPEMALLYDLVGGLPLALKLVAAQLSRAPLDEIAAGLQQANRHAPQTLYTFIYRRIWGLLEPEARQLLLSFLTVSPEGEDATWLQLTSLLPEEGFDPALRQLQSFSLLETSGPVGAPRFRLHRLTSTFLQTEILDRWDGTGSE